MSRKSRAIRKNHRKNLLQKTQYHDSMNRHGRDRTQNEP
ncbi:hypothetical protein LEP1GSC188_0471 [Leptospira weilii serovar Topaz str. LT2116]|uniref:Uncharacterized protein n=1 Tax=Leptospira weilii serovar Topaz str. LT2116 TaxID=1088540 RepID=M3ESU6_9LEPT|nr:hypothetical protein LEP1GSC188_0471 [Leptospira weilii serovar Topaz str. LT2116]